MIVQWPLPCPRCSEPIENGYRLQHHLQSQHGLTKEQATEESVTLVRRATDSHLRQDGKGAA